MAGEHGRIDVGIHHHVCAVADHHDWRAVTILGHGMTPTSGDLVAHAAETEFAIEGVALLHPPALGDFTWRAACRGNQGVVRLGGLVHHRDDLSIGGNRAVGRCLIFVE